MCFWDTKKIFLRQEQNKKTYYFKTIYKIK